MQKQFIGIDYAGSPERTVTVTFKNKKIIKIVERKDLVLNVKKQYFNEIKEGAKLLEFRLCKPYWYKRLVDADGSFKDFNKVVIRLGYPKKGDSGRELTRPYRGTVRLNVQHEIFGENSVEVFGIIVNEGEINRPLLIGSGLN